MLRLLRSVRVKGFTLLELILVLMILAVAAALVIPTIGNRFTTADPRRTAVQLRATMDLMRVRAVRGGREEVLVVSPQANSYWREGGPESVEVPPEGGFLSARGRFVREQDEVEFHFYPDGTNSGGEVLIEKRRGTGQTAYVLSLNPLLGTATVARTD